MTIVLPRSISFANNSRGYKMLPHFQIGLWNTHLFIWFAIIYEAPQKEIIGGRFNKKVTKLFKETPKDYVWSGDHMKPDTVTHGDLSKKELQSLIERFQNVKKAELLCGYTIDRESVIEMGPEGLLNKIEEVFKQVAPLYKIALNIK